MAFFVAVKLMRKILQAVGACNNPGCVLRLQLTQMKCGRQKKTAYISSGGDGVSTRRGGRVWRAMRALEYINVC